MLAALLLATAVATTFAIVGRTRGPPWLHVVGKPLIVPPLIFAVVMFPSQLPSAARPWLLTALVLSWVGDVALMGGRRAFPLGLTAFLLAHLAYLLAFAVEGAWRVEQSSWLLVVAPLTWLGLRGVIAHAGKLGPAVLVYALALSMVAWRLLARYGTVEPLSYGLGAAGGLLFLLADALLARRRFTEANLPYAVELGAYAAAQVCIVACTWA